MSTTGEITRIWTSTTFVSILKGKLGPWVVLPSSFCLIQLSVNCKWKHFHQYYDLRRLIPYGGEICAQQKSSYFKNSWEDCLQHKLWGWPVKNRPERGGGRQRRAEAGEMVIILHPLYCDWWNCWYSQSCGTEGRDCTKSPKKCLTLLSLPQRASYFFCVRVFSFSASQQWVTLHESREFGSLCPPLSASVCSCYLRAASLGSC